MQHCQMPLKEAAEISPNALPAEPYGLGIVNAQLSVLKGLEAAKRHGYTFVVPPMIQWWAEKDPSYLLILPFSHFYDQQHFQSFADDYGRPSQLPISRPG